MKKLLLVLVAVMGITFAANAQDNAIGVRLGGGQGYNAEISFQKGLGASRLEFDLGYHNWENAGSFALSALYQFHKEFGSVPSLGWYLGVGGKLDYYSGAGSSAVAVGVLGQAGLDYHFNAVPLQLSLDIRPCFYVVPNTYFHWGDIALGIRYMF
jgi:opacity protein-like surface antigen